MPVDIELLEAISKSQADQEQPDPHDPAALPYFDYVVHMGPKADNAVLVVKADQRDLRRAMTTLGGIDSVNDPLGIRRATAWAFLKRTGGTEWPWIVFDAEVPFVLDAKEQTYADPTTVDTAT